MPSQRDDSLATALDANRLQRKKVDMMEPVTPAILADARWLAHRYDRQRDEIHFVWLPRDAHRSAAFLTRPEIAQSTNRQIVPRASIDRTKIPQAPLHFIFHSGLTGSTLLTHALDRPGQAMALSEPPILTNVMSYRLAGASQQQAAALLDDVVALSRVRSALAKP